MEYWDAVTQFAYWGAPTAPRLFGDTFVIEVWLARGEIWMHNTRIPIGGRSACCLIARTHPSTGTDYTVTLDFERGEWRLEGDAQATGTMRRRQ